MIKAFDLNYGFSPALPENNEHLRTPDRVLNNEAGYPQGFGWEGAISGIRATFYHIQPGAHIVVPAKPRFARDDGYVTASLHGSMHITADTDGCIAQTGLPIPAGLGFFLPRHQGWQLKTAAEGTGAVYAQFDYGQIDHGQDERNLFLDKVLPLLGTARCLEPRNWYSPAEGTLSFLRDHPENYVLRPTVVPNPGARDDAARDKAIRAATRSCR